MVSPLKEAAPGTILFYCTYESENDIIIAKMYCQENGLTPGDVSIKTTYKDPDKKIKESVYIIKK